MAISASVICVVETSLQACSIRLRLQEFAHGGREVAAEFAGEVHAVDAGGGRDLRQAHLPQEVCFQILPCDVQPARDHGHAVRA